MQSAVPQGAGRPAVAQVTQVLATLGESSTGALSLDAADAANHAPHESRVRLAYFAEGAANVIFSIEILPHESQQASGDELSCAHKLVDGHLLRLRKGTRAPDDHTALQEHSQKSVAPPPFVPVKEIDSFLKDHVLQSIPAAYVVDHVLVEVHAAFIAQCNAALLALESAQLREHKRCGWLINTTEPHAFLVADMTARSTAQLTIELKPKWLAQSPLAPANARRCRTCAWHVRNNVPAAKRYCPLALASGRRDWARAELDKCLPASMELPELWDRQTVLSALTDFFCRDSSGVANDGMQLLRLLQKLQLEWDGNGAVSRVGIEPVTRHSASKAELLAIAQAALVDEANYGFQKLSWAMTLRDCILFVRISKKQGETEYSIASKIADLDLKRVEADKLLKWTMDELDLVHDGYYLGTETQGDMDDICLLWDT